MAGFAEVYEAEHIHLPGDKAAVKLLKGGFTPRQIEELRREALMVSKLNHPHIIQLRTFSVERSIPYLVMTYAQANKLTHFLVS
jgi:serine/threonine protein kinase